MDEDTDLKDLLSPYRVSNNYSDIENKTRSILFALETISLQLNAIGIILNKRKE